MDDSTSNGFAWDRLLLSLLAIHVPALIFAAFFHRGHHFDDLLPVVPYAPFIIIAMLDTTRSQCLLPWLGYGAVIAYHAISVMLLWRHLAKAWISWFIGGCAFATLNLLALAGRTAM